MEYDIYDIYEHLPLRNKCFYVFVRGYGGIVVVQVVADQPLASILAYPKINLNLLKLTN